MKHWRYESRLTEKIQIIISRFAHLSPSSSPSFKDQHVRYCADTVTITLAAPLHLARNKHGSPKPSGVATVLQRCRPATPPLRPSAPLPLHPPCYNNQLGQRALVQRALVRRRREAPGSEGPCSEGFRSPWLSGPWFRGDQSPLVQRALVQRGLEALVQRALVQRALVQRPWFRGPWFRGLGSEGPGSEFQLIHQGDWLCSN